MGGIKNTDNQIAIFYKKPKSPGHRALGYPTAGKKSYGDSYYLRTFRGKNIYLFYIAYCFCRL
jgi:hypothetical protein